MGGLLGVCVGGGGGERAKGMLAPLSNYSGGAAPPPPPPRPPAPPPLPTPMISSHSFISILYPFPVLSGNTAHLRYLINEIVNGKQDTDKTYR